MYLHKLLLQKMYNFTLIVKKIKKKTTKKEEITGKKRRNFSLKRISILPFLHTPII